MPQIFIFGLCDSSLSNWKSELKSVCFCAKKSHDSNYYYFKIGKMHELRFWNCSSSSSRFCTILAMLHFDWLLSSILTTDFAINNLLKYHTERLVSKSRKELIHPCRERSKLSFSLFSAFLTVNLLAALKKLGVFSLWNLIIPCGCQFVKGVRNTLQK